MWLFFYFFDVEGIVVAIIDVLHISHAAVASVSLFFFLINGVSN